MEEEASVEEIREAVARMRERPHREEEGRPG